MNAEAVLLDYAVFQLTPTRTRCDLVIVFNGNKEKEKIASGLVSPFLAHLKSAQDQFDKCGYSITLQPRHDSEAKWFTKATLERFVRFVSTPEILERVNTIESEILQIEEAIAIQGNESLGSATVEVGYKRSAENMEGGKQMASNDAEKAIVLYMPGAEPPQSNGLTDEAENSKVQLMRVLETRRSVLHKEQGMAFARALAAGFDMDHVTHLISFSECFGAGRMLMACLKFMELWRRKHETGQWLEIEAAEALSMRSEFSPINASGIMLSGSNCDRSIEGNGKNMNDDRRVPGNSQVPSGPHDYPQGQFQHPMYPQWSTHSPPNSAVFKSYPIHGMPYHPSYTGSGPFYHSPYNQTDDPRFKTQRRKKKNRHSLDRKESNDDSDDGDIGVTSTESPDDSVDEASEGKASHKKISKSGKKHHGVVVIRNINYITSKKHGASGSEHGSDSNSEVHEENGNSSTPGKALTRSKAGNPSLVESDLSKEEDIEVQGMDSGNWQVFQSFLLRNEENRSSASDQAVFSSEKGVTTKRRQADSGMDPILHSNQNSGNISNGRMVDFDTVDERIARGRKMGLENDLISSSGQIMPSQTNFKFREMEGGRARHGTNDDFLMYGRDTLLTSRSLDPLADDGAVHFVHADKNGQHNINDESFIVPSRSHSWDPAATSQSTINTDPIFQADTWGKRDSAINIQNKGFNEPNDLSLMPERDINGEPTVHDPAIYYDMEMQANKASITNETQKEIPRSTKRVTKSDKEMLTRALHGTQEKKKMEATRRGKPSKLNPSSEAQARAEKLRAYKVDLQKLKKEKEAEAVKRLEDLKRERQRRIAARGTSSSVQRGSTLQNRSQMPSKLSPNLQRGSKFSDAVPASATTIQRLPVRRASTGSSISQRAMATDKSGGIIPSRKGLNRSAGSLPELNKESKSTSDKKVISVTRRLSDPRGGAHHSSLKSGRTVQVSKSSSSISKGSKSAHGQSLKSQTIDRFEKRDMSEEPQINKLSAIINLDKSKTATLPELKLRSSVVQTDRQTKQKTISFAPDKRGDDLALTSEIVLGKRTMEKASQYANGDEALVIEKNVVTQERERSGIPLMTSPVIIKMSGASNETEIEGQGARDPPPVTQDAPIKDPIKSSTIKQPTSYEVVNDGVRKLSTSIHSEKPYQAPHARLSSMESISDLDHPGALISTAEMVRQDPDTMESHISDSIFPTLLEQQPEISEKSLHKESKGFKRFLKFGKKSQSSPNEEGSKDSGGSSTDSHKVSLVSSNGVPSLKHLISEEDSRSGSAPPKASRSFSILSPFRIKNSEKKIAT